MEIQKALELLRQYQDEIKHLKTLPPHNNEYRLWQDKVNVVLAAAFGKDSDEYKNLNPKIYVTWLKSEAEEQEEYLRDLEERELGITKILQKYEILGIPTTSGVGGGNLPSVFIAHGGKTAARDKLEDFLTVLGVTPIIVEEQPSQGRSKDKNVEYYLKQCDCAIILATKGDVDGRTGEFIPRGNILIEIGRCQEILPDRMIYLLEEGAKFPTNIDEKVWERFTQESIDKAFIKVAKELRAFGLIRATKLGG
jgi:hypothetical protein